MKPSNLVEMLYRTVQRFPEKIAYMWKEKGFYQSITYSELWNRIYHAASGFKRLGIQKDDKVAILSDSNPMWPITDFALASIGAISVPVYSTLPANQVGYILENAEVRAIVVQNEIQRQKVLDSGIALEYLITMYPEDETRSEGELSFSSLEILGKEDPYETWQESWLEIDREQLNTLIYTSGTTGKPKGVMLTHGNFLANIEAVQFWFIELLPEDVALSYLPLSHVFERMAGHYTLLSVGVTIAYAESIETIQDNLKEIRPTIMTTVPRLLEKVYAKVMDEIDNGSSIKKKIFHWAVKTGMERYQNYINSPIQDVILGDILPKKLARQWKLANRLVYRKVKTQLGGRLRGLVSGGGTLNAELAKFFWAINIPILEGYGLTETAPVITLNPMTRAKAGTVGKVLTNLDIKISEDGEVLVKGPSVMKGYYKNEQANLEAFEGEWFKTGDIGEIDDNQYLKIIDRKKRILVLSTGKNVAPLVVENAINESLFIEQSLVVGDQKKFVICLVNPDFETLIPWAEKRGIATETLEKLCRHPKVQELINREVSMHVEGLADFEKPKKVLVIGERWSIESGELTPKLSIKINVVQEKYQELIDSVYKEADNSSNAVKVG